MSGWTPHAYQKKAVKFGVERAVAGFFLDPGLGKTSISYAIFKVLKAKKLVDSMLVVAPLRVCYSVWPAEAKKWANFNGLKVVVLHGKDKDRLLREPADVYVVNPDGLQWLAKQKMRLPEMLVVDESTKFKHHRTQRFKTLKALLPKFRRRYILTGTPAPNGLLDLFGQIYILDGGRSLGHYITHYRNKWFSPTGYGGYTWVPREGAEEEIYAALRPYVLRLAGSDYLELPPLIGAIGFEQSAKPLVIEVELPPAARKIYDNLEKELIADLGSKVVVLSNAVMVSGKCRQLANGGLYTDLEGGGREVHQIHDAKTEAVVDLLEELSGQPALVAFEFTHDRDRLLKALGKDTPYIDGSVKPKRVKELEAAWNRGELPVILCQGEVVAHGLNLQEAGRAIIWHSLTYDLETYIQLIRRIWRQGQTGRVFVYHIVARDTVDEAVLKALTLKDKGQAALLKALKEYASSKNRGTCQKQAKKQPLSG